MDIKNLLCSPTFNDTASLLLHPGNLSESPVWSTYSSDCSLTSPCSSSWPSSPVLFQQSRGPQTRTPWTPEEDDLLQQGYMEGLSWAMISSTYLPHRSRGCCWGRFKALQTKAAEQREWTSTDDRLLMMAVKRHEKLFKQAWKSVAVDMRNGRTWRECELRTSKIIRKKQQLHTC
ncbi:hypothetical protein BX666DRAFT_1864928 [Dichotomocladium elegans]|nr:hypothetical protein BX666DRAFT_1864928 [Dichotomocladium elegans]